MRVLILGARGQLGKDLVARFADLGDVTGVDLDEVDIADRGAVLRVADLVRPEVVVNAAAYTLVDEAESDRAGAFAANVTGAENAAGAAAKHGASVVYFSTDYVFDGEGDRPYLPEDAVNPRGVYAESKAAGEAATKAACDAHYVVRTAWLYGPGGDNFVEKILRAAAVRPELKVVDDEVGSPTHTYDLAEATACLVRTGRFGTYHGVNAGVCTRFEFAEAIVSMSGLETGLARCGSDAFPTVAPRPAYSVLDRSKLEEAAEYSFRPWREALRHYIERRESLG